MGDENWVCTETLIINSGCTLYYTAASKLIYLWISLGVVAGLVFVCVVIIGVLVGIKLYIRHKKKNYSAIS